MLRLIQCEFLKLKRLKFVQATLALAVLFPFVLTAYVFSDGNGFEMLYRFVFLYGDLLFKPCILGILGVMLLSAEQDSDTFKNMLTIPVSKRKLFYAKLFLLLCLSVAYSAIELLATALGGTVLGGGQGISIYLRCSLVAGIMSFFDALPLVLLFCLLRRTKVFAMLSSLFYAIAGFLLVNSYASGMSVSIGIVPFLPRIVIFRWFLHLFSLEQNSASLLVPGLPAAKAFLILFCMGAVMAAAASALYGRKEAAR